MVTGRKKQPWKNFVLNSSVGRVSPIWDHRYYSHYVYSVWCDRFADLGWKSFQSLAAGWPITDEFFKSSLYDQTKPSDRFQILVLPDKFHKAETKNKASVWALKLVSVTDKISMQSLPILLLPNPGIYCSNQNNCTLIYSKTYAALTANF
jgi:hypothetical protein